MTMNVDPSDFFRSTPLRRLQAGAVVRMGVLPMLLVPMLSVLSALFCGNAAAALGQGPLPGAQAPAAPPPLASPSQSVWGPKIQAASRPAGVGYTVYESVLESGTAIKEYATADGVVFAVRWRGPVLPDLNVLLGGYFKAFSDQAQQARAAGRRGSPMVVTTDALVVNSAGRMRNFAGWAYAPGWVPAETSIKDVLQ